MAHSATPILNLESPVPVPQVRLTLRGLLKAIPAAIGVIAIAFMAMYLAFSQNLSVPSWLAALCKPFLEAIETIFDQGVFVGIAIYLAVIFLVTIVHELGHALTAMALGWRLLEVRVAPLLLQKPDDKWKLSVSWKLWPGALVVADFRTFNRFHIKGRTFALGGPGANLIGGIIAGLIRPGSSAHISSAIGWLFILVSLGIGLINLLPGNFHGLELDGYSAFVVSRRPLLLAARIASLRLRNQILSGKPVMKLNRRWLALAESPGSVSLQNRGGLWVAYCYWLEKKEFERAAILLEKMLRACNNDDLAFRALVFAECAVFWALRGNRDAALAWNVRTEDLFLPEFVRCRANSFVAFSQGDHPKALSEALKAKEAVQKLDSSTREVFLAEWNPWVESLKTSATGENI